MVSEWDDLCAAWEADKVPKTTLNPFCILSDGRLVNSLWIYRYSYSSVDLTKDEVHKELAEEEEARRRSGGRVVHNMSPSAFMVFGLVLEESQ